MPTKPVLRAARGYERVGGDYHTDKGASQAASGFPQAGLPSPPVSRSVSSAGTGAFSSLKASHIGEKGYALMTPPASPIQRLPTAMADYSRFGLAQMGTEGTRGPPRRIPDEAQKQFLYTAKSDGDCTVTMQSVSKVKFSAFGEKGFEAGTMNSHVGHRSASFEAYTSKSSHVMAAHKFGVPTNLAVRPTASPPSDIPAEFMDIPSRDTPSDISASFKGNPSRAEHTGVRPFRYLYFQPSDGRPMPTSCASTGYGARPSAYGLEHEELVGLSRPPCGVLRHPSSSSKHSVPAMGFNEDGMVRQPAGVFPKVWSSCKMTVSTAGHLQSDSDGPANVQNKSWNRHAAQFEAREGPYEEGSNTFPSRATLKVPLVSQSPLGEKPSLSPTASCLRERALPAGWEFPRLSKPSDGNEIGNTAFGVTAANRSVGRYP
jgi:hypothetical protein